MKKIFLTLAVLIMAICASAQKNQYFWYQGNLMLGNPIAQIDSVTFGNEDDTDSIIVYLPRTIIKTVEVHDTLKITVHDTLRIYDDNKTPRYMGHELVDLGLPSGLLWATCNIGAETPEQVGNYYAWGEIQNRTDFTENNYAFAENQLTLNDISATEYDAARSNWGGEWRMPTKQECNELISNCEIMDTTINGINGKLLIGLNSNRMFVPSSGHYGLTGLENTDGIGFWISTPCGSSYAYRMWQWTYISFSQRWLGFPVRPVVQNSSDIQTQIGDALGTKIIHDTVYITIHDTVCPNDIPEGTLNGEFSVAADKKIRFSKGNLQYNATLGSHLCADGTTKQGTWRFAENQWDFVGDETEGNVYENGTKCNNVLISSSYNGWIDLFGWGTSGWNDCDPTLSTTSTSDYGLSNQDIENTYYDWGLYNSIENGGNEPGLWYTLSQQEANYLLNQRENSDNLRTCATVCGVGGIIILPDAWQLPANLNILISTTDFSSNILSIDEWDLMEKAGAVFLPVTNARYGTGLLYSGTGSYQSTTNKDSNRAYSSFEFHTTTEVTAEFAGWKYWGRSIRLVQNVE